MAARPRIALRSPSYSVRHVLGVDVSGDCRRVRAAPLAAYGNGLHLNVRVGRPVSVDLPARAAELNRSLVSCGNSDEPNPFSRLMELRAILTEHVAIAAQEAVVKNSGVLSEMLAIGVNEAGKVASTEDGQRGCFEGLDAGRLADLTGLNVVSGFPARDLASGGNGHPLSPLPLWLLFRSAHRERLFLHVGRMIRLARLPRLTGSLSSVSGLAFRLTHGMALVDLLVRELTGGRCEYDLGGRLAVQGRRVDELVAHWLERTETFELPAECDAPRMLQSAVALAVQGGWSVYDMLCSASHFVAESAARKVERIARDGESTEVILSGGGLANGLILRHLTARLSCHSLQRIEQLGGESDVVPPAVAGTLALLHFDQVPANVAGLTGAETARVLGSLTPGTPQAWQRLLASFSSGGHSIRPLRVAL